MKLTEKQKNCPYCHKEFKSWRSHKSTGISKIVKENNQWQIYTIDEHGDWYEDMVVDIECCPKCGRPLNEEEE